MEVLCTIRYFLGIEVTYSPRGHLLSQSKYIANILEQAHISNTRATKSPLKLNLKYALFNGFPLPHITIYRALVGSLSYDYHT